MLSLLRARLAAPRPGFASTKERKGEEDQLQSYTRDPLHNCLPTKYERGKTEREGQDLLYYLHDSNVTISLSPTTNGYCLDHTSRDSALGSGLSALESNKTLIMRPVSRCLSIPLRISNALRDRHHQRAALSLMSVYTRSDECLLLGS
jgi:hypothetical protein